MTTGPNAPPPPPPPPGPTGPGRLAALLAAFLLSLGGALAVASPAHADPADDWPHGYVIFYDWYAHNNQGTNWGTHVQNSYGPNCVTLPAALRDKATSMYFNTSLTSSPHRIRYFLWANCNPGGGYFTLQATVQANNIYDLTCPAFAGQNPCNSFYNNNIVSFDWIPG
jgi:hypothetical protein